VTSKIKLPETPTVVARDSFVVIVYDDSTEHTWGEEKTREEAVRVAHELEIELRAIQYVRWHVSTFVREMKEYLRGHGINESLLNSILIDGHSFVGPDLDHSTLESIFERASQGVRLKVLKKIGSHNFIV